MFMNRSLRRRLLVFLLSATVAVWAESTFLSYVDSRREIEAVFDAQLVQSAKALLLLSRHELFEQLSYEAAKGRPPSEMDERVMGSTHPYEQSVAFQIWIDGDRLAARSASAPNEPLTDVTNTVASREINGARWRIYAVADPNLGITVQVGERTERREQLIDAIALRRIISLLVALPLLASLIWFAVGQALRPLNRIANEVGARRVDSLEPVSTEQPVPEETQPLVAALNALFARVKLALDNERRFTADAAHELRTPLAALKTQAQVALQASSDGERRTALQAVLAGVDRATHLVAQLLTLARLDPEAQRNKPVTMTVVDLCDVARDTLADMAPRAIEKRIDLGLQEPCGGRVYGNVDMLGIMLRNLVENALRYTPEGGRVEVVVNEAVQGPTLWVLDSGPGIPEEDRQKVFDRFYRRLGTSEPGSGLGLSIVKRILEIHGALPRLERSALGGLSFEVRFAPVPIGNSQQ